MKKFLHRSRSFLGTGGSVLLFVALAQTLPGQPQVVPDLTLNAPGLGVAVTYTPDAAVFRRAADGKTWELSAPGSIHVPDATWLTVKDLKFDADPLIYGNLLVQNTTALTQTYTFGFSLPTTWGSPNLIRGSIDTSIIGTDGLISAVPGSSIYSAQIDAVTVRTMQDAPFSLSTPQPAASFSSLFGFELNNIAVNSSIGIVIKFQLSPGDVAAIISDFEVVDVPETSSLTLLLVGGAVLRWRRQRR